MIEDGTAGSSKDRGGCAPVFGSTNQSSQSSVYQTVAAHQEVVQSLKHSKEDGAAPDVVRKQRETVVSAHLMNSRLEHLQPGQKKGEELKELYPRRWYDSFMPVQLFDSRPTVGEVLSQLEREGNDAAWRTERKARTTEYNSIKAGTIVFWVVVFVLVVTPILERARLNGPLSPMCFEEGSEECEVVPYPRLALYCALCIVVMFKACSVDMSCGPWGALPHIFAPAFGRSSSLDFVQQEGQHALPRTLTGAVPESEREGIHGYLERLCGIWHGCLGSFAVGVLLLLNFSKHMRDDYALKALSGKPVETGAVILAKPGTLDDETVDLSRCLAMIQKDILVVAGEYFGMRNLVLFMLGAVLFGIGELFKLRAVQDYPAKGFLSMDVILRISKPWIWSSQVESLKLEADRLAVTLKAQSRQAAAARMETTAATPPSASVGPEGTPLVGSVALDPDVEEKAQLFAESLCEVAENLLNRSWYNIGQMNFWRVAWAAAFQIAGVALWVPLSQSDMEPCLHQTERWSIGDQLVEDAVDKSEILSFGSVAVLISTLLFLLYLPCIPYELRSFSAYNPANWIVKISKLEEVWEDFRPEAWLRLMVDGLFLVFICNALLFGQLGAQWKDNNIFRIWAVDPWFLWQIQVGLYAFELTLRWFGNTFLTGSNTVKPSEAEEAVHAVQLQDMLLELLHQVADAGPHLRGMDKTLSSTSATLQVKVFEKYRHNLKFRNEESVEDYEGTHEEERTSFQTRTPGATRGPGAPQAAVPNTSGLTEFIVDNRWLKAQTDGLSYRNSKSMEDHDVTRPVAPWYSVVFGVDEEDGWVRLEDGSYLPSFVNDVPVLTIPQDDEGAP
mmetsp:Transcript_19869/g.46478  ORF Transcript_19869/g.46478 Transcript_19869/m.46478 type:complete len:844 (-) Transcript_19869:350-2881(-)